MQMAISAQGFQRTAEAIRFLRIHADESPSLASLAAHLGVVPAVAQREFRRLVGISPKRFLQDLAARRAGGLLDRGADLLSASLDAGLSGPGRLHDHLIRVEAVSPGEWKAQGKGLVLRHGIGETRFGPVWIVLTPRGVHRLEFVDSHAAGAGLLNATRLRFPLATLIDDPGGTQALLDRIFTSTASRFDIQVVATPFQLSVWKAILRLPVGSITTYRRIAMAVSDATRTRAVAQALAANPVAMLIPCHRVLREDGALAGYRWGCERKLALLAGEESLGASPDGT